MKIINPATGELITDLPDDDAAGIMQKLFLLRQAQPGWQKVSLENRVSIIQNFASLMEKNLEDLASVLSMEVGKPLQQARNEVNGALSRIKWLSGNAVKYLSDEIMHSEEGLEERIAYEPLGVIGNISAWNYPLLVGVNVFIPALLAGNAVLYKPSEYATLTGLELKRLLTNAGVPDHVFLVATGGADVGKLMMDLDLDGYFFTGSYKTGKC